MSITSAKTGATGISLALENNYMEPIASVLVGSGGVNQVTFNDIPQTYKHLQIRAMHFAPTGDNVAMRINGDYGPYPRHQVYGDGSGVAANASTTNNAIQIGLSGTSSGPGVFVTDILDYANTNKNKTIRALCGYDANGSGYVVLRSGLYMSTTPVTSIFIFSENGNISQYSRFSLYGIRG